MLAARKQQMLDLAKAALRDAGMEAGGKHREIGLKVMEHILQHGSINRQDYSAMVGIGLADQLLDFKVFSLSPASNEVTFYSKLVESYVRMEGAQRKIQEAGGILWRKRSS